MQQTTKHSPFAPTSPLNRYRDTGVVSRLILVLLLTMTLFEALNWAMDVTNANAKRISANFDTIRKDAPSTQREGERVSMLTAGPVIEALEEKPRKRK